MTKAMLQREIERLYATAHSARKQTQFCPSHEYAALHNQADECIAKADEYERRLRSGDYDDPPSPFVS